MKEQITVRGLVIAQSPVGEYDRRVVILTLEKGKISAFARGAKKPNSMLSGVSQPMTFGTFYLYPQYQRRIRKRNRSRSYVQGTGIFPC